MGQEVPVDLLAHHVRAPGPQYPPGAAQMGLELGVPGLWRAGSQGHDDQGGVVGEAAGREQVGQQGVGEGFGVGGPVAGQGAGEAGGGGVGVFAGGVGQGGGGEDGGGGGGGGRGGPGAGGGRGAGGRAGG